MYSAKDSTVQEYLESCRAEDRNIEKARLSGFTELELAAAILVNRWEHRLLKSQRGQHVYYEDGTWALYSAVRDAELLYWQMETKEPEKNA